MGQLSGRVELYMVYVSTMFHLLLLVYIAFVSTILHWILQGIYAKKKMMFFGHIVRKTALKKDWYSGRWKASGEGADQQRPGSRILKTG